jgi:opacity protein-like surface antigen
VPIVGPSWNGTRLSGETQVGGVRVKPTSGLALGGAFELKVSGHFALTGMTTWSTLGYEVEADDPRDSFISSGSQEVLRFSGGVNYRFRDTARGYLTGGVAANLFRTGDVLKDEVERTEWGGYAGLGVDFNAGNPRFRMEGRTSVTRVDTSDPSLGGFTLQPQGWVADWLLLAGIAIGF